MNLNSTPAHYALVSGKEYGPYTLPDLHAAIADNTIEADCLVRQGLSGEWKPVTDVLGLTEAFVAPTKLAAIRINSAYRPLRTLINAAAIVALLSLVIIFGVAAWKASAPGQNLSIYVAAQIFGSIAGTLISWGLAHVLIDLADIQLARK